MECFPLELLNYQNKVNELQNQIESSKINLPENAGENWQRRWKRFPL